MQTMPAQTGPKLSLHMQTGYAGITVTGTVSATYTIEATTNLAVTNGWVALTNVVLPTSPWVYIDYASPGMANRFYRASGLVTNAPVGMALIPAGSFTMGNTFNEGYSDELPTHTVYVSAFYMDKTEVTKGLWDEVKTWATAHGYSFDDAGLGKAANHPVHTVCWYDVVKWCNARSEKEERVPAYYTDAAQTIIYKTGQVNVENGWVKWNEGYRLPTEAEWEKAARGGASGHRFPWSDVDTITHSQANYYSTNSYSYDISSTRGYHSSYDNDPMPYTSPVGSFPAGVNGYGLYDMAGNLYEWCWDRQGSYSSGSQTDPRGPTWGSGRVYRGGCWLTHAVDCRVAYRDYGYPDYGYYHRGFRSVLPPGPGRVSLSAAPRDEVQAGDERRLRWRPISGAVG
jgi:formylglycine-generating enzyme required for sulfatase activity